MTSPIRDVKKLKGLPTLFVGVSLTPSQWVLHRTLSSVGVGLIRKGGSLPILFSWRGIEPIMQARISVLEYHKSTNHGHQPWHIPCLVWTTSLAATRIGRLYFPGFESRYNYLASRRWQGSLPSFQHHHCKVPYLAFRSYVVKAWRIRTHLLNTKTSTYLPTYGIPRGLVIRPVKQNESLWHSSGHKPAHDGYLCAPNSKITWRHVLTNGGQDLIIIPYDYRWS